MHVWSHIYQGYMDQPGKVANPARGQLNKENQYFPVVSRDGFGSPVLRQPAHLYTQVESDAYSRDSSRVPRRRPFIYFKLPYALGSAPSLSGRAIAYRWRSLPRVCRRSQIVGKTPKKEGGKEGREEGGKEGREEGGKEGRSKNETRTQTVINNC